MSKSFEEANKLFKSSVVLSKTWISKHYPNCKFSFYGVPIEKVGAFSQHHFFSIILSGLSPNNVWNQYPEALERLTDTKLDLIKTILKIVRYIKELVPKESKINLKSNHEVVFLASGRHLKDNLKLIEFIHRKHDVIVVGKIQKEIKRFLAFKKIQFVDIRSGSSFLSYKERFNYFKNIVLDKWEATGKSDILNNPVWDKRLLYLKLFQFREIVGLLKVANHIFVQAAPSLILTTSSNDTFGSAFCLTAQRMKIPVAELQHGYASWASDREFANCDYHLVWGEIPKRIYSNYSKRIIVVGCPFLKLEKTRNNKSVTKKGKINILVLISPPFGVVSLFKSMPNYQMVEDLIKGLMKLPKNFTTTIRSHPSYDLAEDVRDLKITSNIKITNEGELIEIIKRSDLVITQSTTAGFMAAMYQKPLLFFNNSWINQKYKDSLIESGGAKFVPTNSICEINRYILNLLSDKNMIADQQVMQGNYVKNYCQYLNGKSLIKIHKFIERVAGSNVKSSS